MKERLKDYIKRIDHARFGEPKSYSKSALGSVCDTTSDWKDVLSVYLTVEEDRVVSMGAKCGPCDPIAYAVLHALLVIIPGMTYEEVTPCSSKMKEAFTKESGLPLKDEVLEHYQHIVKIVSDLLSDGRNEKPVCQCKINIE